MTKEEYKKLKETQEAILASDDVLSMHHYTLAQELRYAYYKLTDFINENKHLEKEE